MNAPVVPGEYFDPSADVIDDMLDALETPGLTMEDELNTL